MKYPALLFEFAQKHLANAHRLTRKIVSASMADHSERTAKNFRQNVTSDATVIETTTLSPSVIGLKLYVEDHGLTFLAGQWVDLFLPNISQVGGFSICSPPSLLQQTREIHLAVKKSSWPPAEWIHSKCRVGDKVQIRVGGDFHYEPPSNSQAPDIIFIAGGVGINPLLSIMLQLKSLHQTQESQKVLPKNIALLYSARTKEDILFQETISELKRELAESFTYYYFVTRSSYSSENHEEVEEFRESRITEYDLRLAIDNSNPSNLICFICGPPPMTDHFRSELINMGVAPQQIKTEKWW